MMWWRDLSVMGSLAVTGPIGIAIAVWLLAGQSWRLTLSWCLLFGVGMAVVVLTKVAFIGWGIGVEAIEFSGISGHAMRSAAVFPVAFYLGFRRCGPQARLGGTLAGVAVAVLISISRVYVQAHSVSEAVTGTALGLLVAAAFIWHASTEHHLAISRVLLALCIPILLIAPRVEPAPTESWMTALALLVSGHDAPFTRRQWHLPPPARNMAQRSPI
jgi:membrane-associated phospholipid phosphatase